ncbi:MAG: NYN domain-containing protein [Bacteroidota bacterium]
MKKIYVIDGYNVLHAATELKRTLDAFGIDKARGDLMNAIATFAERKKCDCIVVFDGVVDEGNLSTRVRVLSSRTRSADDIIREHARENGRNLVVVSSDLEIIGTARANMAMVVSARDFASELTLGTHSRGLAAPRGGSARPHRIAEIRERSEKPNALSEDDVDEWKKLFGM